MRGFESRPRLINSSVLAEFFSCAVEHSTDVSPLVHSVATPVYAEPSYLCIQVGEKLEALPNTERGRVGGQAHPLDPSLLSGSVLKPATVNRHRKKVASSPGG